MIFLRISVIYEYYFILQTMVVTSHQMHYSKWAGRTWWLLVVTNNSVPVHYDITFSCSNTVAISNDGMQRKHHIMWVYNINCTVYNVLFYAARIQKNHRISYDPIWYDKRYDTIRYDMINDMIRSDMIWYDIWCISGILVKMTCSKQHGGMISKLFWFPN